MSNSKKVLKLVIRNGVISAIYDDALTSLFDQGEVAIKRASHVEPHDGFGKPRSSFIGGWYADMRPVGGPVMVGFRTRLEALNAEVNYLNEKVIK